MTTMTMDERIEAALEKLPIESRLICEEALKAAFPELFAGTHKIVPVEPTNEQGTAGVAANDKRTGFETCCHIYRAMIAAA